MRLHIPLLTARAHVISPSPLATVISHCPMATARPHPFLAGADRKSDRDSRITSQLMRVAGVGVVGDVRRPIAYQLAVIFPRR
jgi:hypothetical protein